LKKIKNFLLNYDRNFYLVVKGAFFNIFTNIFGSLASLLSSFIIAKYFGSSVLGTIAILSSIFAFANLFANFGFSQFIVRLIPEYNQKYEKHSAYSIYKKIAIIRNFFMLITTAIYLLLVPYIEATFFKNSIYPIQIILFMGIFIIPLGSFYVFNLQTIRALKQLFAYNILEVSPRLIFLCLLSISVLFNFNSASVIYIKLLGDILSGILAIFLLHRIWKILHVKSKFLKEIPITAYNFIKMSTPFFLINFLYVMMNQIDILMIGSILDEESVGIYQIATKLTLLISLIVRGVVLFTAPILSELYYSKQTHKIEYFIQQITFIMFVVTIPAYVILMIFGEEILLYFGDEFVSGYITLAIMSTSNLILSWYGLANIFMKMTGDQKILSKIVFFSVAINIIMNFLLISQYGIDGAAFASLISTLFWTIMSSNYVYKKYNYYMFPYINKIKL
jgi:O-antigen/teichoic acid export membrane protein